MCMISIIVPVYNVEKYLSRCLDSILQQTFSDFELILVNDGSTDHSLEICRSYAEKDKRILLIEQKNCGLSAARNAGLAVASGEYVGFVDSDDFISCNMYEELYRSISRHKAELAMCKMVNCYGKVSKLSLEGKETVFSQKEAFREIFIGERCSVWAVNKLYRKTLFDGIAYPVGKTAEDAFVICKLLERTERIVLNEKAAYYYMHRANSVTTQSFSQRTFDVMEAWRYNHEILRQKYPDLEEYGKMRFLWSCFYVMDRACINTENMKDLRIRKIVRYIRGNMGFVLNNRQFTWSRKTAAVGLCLCPALYRQLVLLEQRKRKKLFE